MRTVGRVDVIVLSGEHVWLGETEYNAGARLCVHRKLAESWESFGWVRLLD